MSSRLVGMLGVGTLVIRLGDGRIASADPAAAALLGRGADELTGMHATQAGLVPDAAALDRLAQAAPGRVEATVTTASGAPHAVEMAVERVDGPEPRLELALMGSERRDRAIVDSVSDGVLRLDASDRITFVNPAMATMLGYEVEELLGRDAAEFMIGEVEPISRLAQLNRQSTAPGRHELRMRRRDGGELWVEMSATPLEDGAGRYQGAVSVVVDMTDRRRAQLEREQFEDRLQQAQRLETVGQLAGGVAHDFNNLLAVIINYAYFVREQLPEDSEVRGDVDEIRHAAERASELTHQLLVFSRREPVEPVVLDVNDVVREAERLLGRTIGEDVALGTRLAPQPCTVEADPTQLEQVVVNLVVNARDAMPSGGRIAIETECSDEVVLSVSDRGTGMEPEVAARAFEPFFTTKPKGAGTGLGLATVYGTVTRAGGYAEIDSTPGEGTTVRIHLPHAGVPAPAREADGPAAPARDGAGATVLLVEDEDAVRSLTCRILSGNGFNCLEASGGEDALRLYEQHRERVSLLLTDVVMPGMSGHELAERIAGAGGGPAVLFMSGYAGDNVRDGGGGSILRKPFTADVLLRCVREALSEPET